MKDLGGAAVDVTILLVVAYGADRGWLPKEVAAGFLGALVGARATSIRKGPGGGSAALALLLGLGAMVWHKEHHT